MYTLTEISETTGFDRGDAFTSAEQLRDYFTLAAMRSMFGEDWTSQTFPRWTPEEERVPLDDAAEQLALDGMADTVLEQHWHCAF